MIREALSTQDCLTSNDTSWYIECADVLHYLSALPEQSVDLVFGSPPYETRRPYSCGFSLKGEDWVAWMCDIVRASLRVCRGLVAFVVEGMTSKFRYSAVPALLMADLHRSGVCLRKPTAYHRRGIPGSGGKDRWRNDWEFIIEATNGGQLPWADITATGHEPRWAPGGRPSHRRADGSRVNRGATDGTDSQGGNQPKLYRPPRLANPGNVIHCKVGGGHMGSRLAHENQAPFPESLARPYVLSFCPPGGVCLDPFSGSGTTGAVAVMNGRRFLGCDIDQEMVKVGKLRMAEAKQRMCNESRTDSGGSCAGAAS